MTIVNVRQQLQLSRWMKWNLNVASGQLVWFMFAYFQLCVKFPIWYEKFHLSPILALYNDLDRLKKFINDGQTNKIDSSGYTALHYAARKGHLNVCNELLRARADVNACTRSGNVTPLIRAAMMGKFTYLNTNHCIF